MRKKYLPFILAAAVGAAVGVWGGDATGAMMIFCPFIALAEGMRAMSLSGGAGDALAWALYALLSLLPLLALLPRGRKLGLADGLTVLTSVYSFFYWYAMVNPSEFLPKGFIGAGGMADVYRAMLTTMLYALLFGVAAFRLSEQDGGTDRMLSRLRAALYAVALIVCVTGACAFVLTIRQSMSLGGVHIACAAVQSICSVCVAVAVLLTLLSARALLGGMRGGWFLDGNEALAAALSKRAKALLIAAVLSELLQNGVALALVGRASNVNVAFDLPILEFSLALALLLLSRFIGDGIRMRRENESFV